MDQKLRGMGLDRQRLDRIGAFLSREFVDAGLVAGCQIAIQRRGHPAYAATLGVMDLESGAPLREDAIWRLYSMTKPMTSVALMMLWERGLFQLDEPVARVVPAWSGHRVWVGGEGDAIRTEAPRRLVTFRDLLRHTGGLTYGGALGPAAELPVDRFYKAIGLTIDRSPDTAEAFLAKLGQVPLAYQPGTQWLYSLSTDACGALVEVLSGRPFASFLHEEILAPLGMTDTDFHIPADKVGRFVACYAPAADGGLTLIDDPRASSYASAPVFRSGGGGLLGTVQDYVRFCEMLRRGGELDGTRLLGPRTVAMMRANNLPGGSDLAGMRHPSDVVDVHPGVGFGLGFAVTLENAGYRRASAGDYYWSGAASTQFWIDPKEELSVVFMTQRRPPAGVEFRELLTSLVYAAIID